MTVLILTCCVIVGVIVGLPIARAVQRIVA